MDADVQQALAQDRTIDITTIGRKSGRPRRIEILIPNKPSNYNIQKNCGQLFS